MDVTTVVADLVSVRDLRLIKLADRASLIRTALTADEVYSLITPALYWDDDLGAAAQRVAATALRIGSTPGRDDRVRRRGALLERLVFELVSIRLPGATHHEQEVELTRNPRSRRPWTRPKEVVADGPQFETYECKADALPDVGDIDELSDISTTAAAEGTDARPTVVIFGSEGALRRLAVAWNLTETIYGVVTEDLLGLAAETPSKAIRPAA
jgi:hypothetical protein